MARAPNSASIVTAASIADGTVIDDRVVIIKRHRY